MQSAPGPEMNPTGEAVAARRGISVGRQVPARDSRHETLARRRGASSGIILPVYRKAKSVVRLCPLALGTGYPILRKG